jgi:hypothetical protein
MRPPVFWGLKLGAIFKIQDENSTHSKFLFENNNNLIKLFFLTQLAIVLVGGGELFHP